jgi:Flp pilus assembly protein TadB
MPQAAVVAGIGAAATLGGAVMGSRANSKASQATERATNQALAFEREKEARRRAEHDRYQAERMRQWNAFQAQRAGLLQRWGVPMGGRSMQPQGASSMGARMPSGENERVRLTLGDIARKY